MHSSAGITAGTRVIALLGDPVSHSLSPRFQNAAIRALGIDAAYVALRCSRAAAPGLLDALARAGGGGNVTVPHKLAVVRALEASTDAVQRTGACNTFWLEDRRIIGDNTDVEGFDRAARALIGDRSGIRVLLLGAGGAARAAASALLTGGAARIDLINRSRDRADDLRCRIDPDGRTIRVAATLRELDGEAFDLIVNATSLGLRDGDPEPCDLTRFRSVGSAMDLVYRREGTRWTDTARSMGIAASDGTDMLLMQGAASFERWFGRPAPVDVMREALRD